MYAQQSLLNLRKHFVHVFNRQQLKYAYNERTDIVLESSISYILILININIKVEAMNKTM